MANNGYVIVAAQDYYGPRTVRRLAGDGEIFRTHVAAREWIDAAEAGIHRAQHNESGRPAYSIRRADDLPSYLRSQL